MADRSKASRKAWRTIRKKMEAKSKRSLTARRSIKLRHRNMRKAAPYIKKCAEQAHGDICVVCGEFFEFSLGSHHLYGRKFNAETVTLCGSCHKVFDKHKGLKELKKRHKRYFKYNRMLRSKMKVS